jgi:DNA-directed RNA polymerase specialized sigma24 family protein
VAPPFSDLSRPASVQEWLESPYLLRAVCRVAYEHGIPRQDVPDLFQDVRLALWAAGPSKTVNATWVFHTANHKAIDALARLRRMSSWTMGGLGTGISPNAPDPSLARLLKSRVDRLPQRLRRFYCLRYREGLSQREVARQLGVCRGSARWMEVRCLSFLKGRRSGDVRPVGIAGRVPLRAKS